MAVPYDYYRIFYYVAKYHSFTRAAKILMNSQPNITRAMNNLESALGCQLFFRSHRGTALTPEGKKLYAHVQIAQEHLQAGEAEIMNDNTLQSGHISIGATEIALHNYLLPILSDFRIAYPGVHIQITNHSTAEAIKAIRSGLVEFAVVTSPADISTPLKEYPLKTFQEILVTGSHYHSLIDHPLSLKELSDYPLVFLGHNTKSFEFFDKIFQKAGAILEPAIEAATADQILPMVRYNLGLGFLPKSFAADAIKEGIIFPVPLKEEIPPRQICLVQDQSRPLGIAARQLKKMLFEQSDTNHS
ncbi:MAG: LysR family transcriptional regulator [Eubacterium sp.]|nr:LysR family transcriptional regulator [Eubacterium sp.]